MDENTYSMHYAFRKEALLWDGFYVVFHLKNKVQNGGGGGLYWCVWILIL